MINGATKKVLFIFLAGLLAGCSGSEDSERPGQNEPSDSTSTAGYVEQATFTTLEGDTVSVNDYEGKVVMIDLWETWCKPCLESFPTLQKLQEEYADDFVLLAVRSEEHTSELQS